MSEDDIWAEYSKGVKKLSAEKDDKPKRAAKPKQVVKEEKAFVPEESKTSFEEMMDGAPPMVAVVKKENAVQEPKKEKPVPVPSRQPEILDVRIERNLSLGEVVIEAKCDLHGQTEEEAHETFQAFVEKQNNLNRRLLLIITGRGKEGQSVLKKNLPCWCEVPPLRDKILALRTAAQHHGGDGAYYLLLKKK